MLESDLIIPITNGQRLPPPTHRLESWTVSTAEELVDGESSQTGWVLDQKASPVPLSTYVLLRKCWVSYAVESLLVLITSTTQRSPLLRVVLFFLHIRQENLSNRPQGPPPRYTETL
jgi:hypothetical protein